MSTNSIATSCGNTKNLRSVSVFATEEPREAHRAMKKMESSVTVRKERTGLLSPNTMRMQLVITPKPPAAIMVAAMACRCQFS